MSSEARSEQAGQGGPHPQDGARPWVGIGLIWILLTTAGVAAALLVPRHVLSSPDSASGADLLRTVEFFSVLAAPVIAAVVAVAGYSLMAWRTEGARDVPPPVQPGVERTRAASTIWVTASVVLVAVILGWGFSSMGAGALRRADVLQVSVTGHQWLWTFSYPGTRVSGQTLVLPVGRPVEFRVTSDDVTHGFHPVQLGTQVDAVPGKTTVLHVTPNRLGRFQVDCTQICGLYHSLMITSGSVVSPADFGRWLASRGVPTIQAERIAKVHL